MQLPSDSDKWIRSLKDNPAGKVVNDSAGSHWEWDRAELDETSRLLQKLTNNELAIEQADIVPDPHARPPQPAGPPGRKASHSQGAPRKRPSSHDPGGGFNPYDHSGKPRR